MTETEAISKAQQIAKFYGLELEGSTFAELITKVSPIVEKYPDRMSNKIGWWFVSLSPDPPRFDGEEWFYINNDTGKVVWQGKPWWIKLCVLLSKYFKRIKR